MGGGPTERCGFEERRRMPARPTRLDDDDDDVCPARKGAWDLFETVPRLRGLPDLVGDLSVQGDGATALVRCAGLPKFRWHGCGWGNACMRRVFA